MKKKQSIFKSFITPNSTLSHSVIIEEKQLARDKFLVVFFIYLAKILFCFKVVDSQPKKIINQFIMRKHSENFIEI